MSLRDTIEGARQEAQGNLVRMPKKEAEAAASEAATDEKRGFSRRSASRAKPASAAAASVRSESKPRSVDPLKSETKEEKRARKAREREEDDLRARAYDVVMRSIPGYKKVEHGFWIFLGVGMALAVLTFVLTWASGGNTDLSSPYGIACAVVLALAYACIIAAFIYDLKKRRPFRKEAESRIRGLSNKKVIELLEREREKSAKAGK